jgi:hypothetical protein
MMAKWVVALIVFLAVALGGWADFSGRWTGTLNVLPTLGLEESELQLEYYVANWRFTSISGLTASGFNSQILEAAGMWGIIATTARLEFDPTLPAYKHFLGTVSIPFGGVTFTGTIQHWVYPYYPSNACVQTGPAYLEYVWRVDFPPFAATVKFADCCYGGYFKDLTVTFSDISPCCDLYLSGTLTFSKAAGFEYLDLWLKDVAFCPGCISLDFNVHFAPEGKEISVEPDLDFPVDACFTLYGDIDFEVDRHILEAISIQGFKIRCELTECSYLESKTAFTPGTLGFSEDEFEYLRVHVCGPACCGQDYTGEFTVYFSTTGGFLGLSRFTFATSLPLLANFVLEVELDYPLGGTLTLDLGWDFSF